jgi:hypothetical protein
MATVRRWLAGAGAAGAVRVVDGPEEPNHHWAADGDPDAGLHVPRPRACPAWCRNEHTAVGLRRMHNRVVWEHIARGDIDFCVGLHQDGGTAPKFEFSFFDPDPGRPDGCDARDVRLSVAQVRSLRDALSEALRAVGATAG